ncbi:hypothetical protein [Dictyobacter kobayashii]|uniref:Uncharacterized protein n=1 Tax=Dictyobacter kobayashii TaxID=2014872 RepID=A0A402AM37_9CHLR|nr:hypothetical protein [Dictyobacter kobayashii]GCE20186.1 hypothetical protein KDK_39860 [Dictyobacter kobayashii]
MTEEYCIILLQNLPYLIKKAQGYFMFLFGACGAGLGVWSVWSGRPQSPTPYTPHLKDGHSLDEHEIALKKAQGYFIVSLWRLRRRVGGVECVVGDCSHHTLHT